MNPGPSDPNMHQETLTTRKEPGSDSAPLPTGSFTTRVQLVLRKPIPNPVPGLSRLAGDSVELSRAQDLGMLEEKRNFKAHTTYNSIPLHTRVGF